VMQGDARGLLCSGGEATEGRGGEVVAGKWEKLTSSVTACGREGDRVVMPVLGGEEVGSVGTWSL
jgi:hypothetical protein